MLLPNKFRSIRPVRGSDAAGTAAERRIRALTAATHGCAMTGHAIAFLGLFCLYPACADIYSYTDSDGAVYLGNAPMNKHARVLVSASDEDAAALQSKNFPREIASTLYKKLQYDPIVEEVARTYGMDSALLHAVISVESNYNPNAVSKNGASGLMQLMPVIAKHYGVVNILDPVQNLHGGAQYLRDMLILFNNDVSLAVAAYNAGETAVVRYGNRIPPFQETMAYVPKVLNLYREYQANRPDSSDAQDLKAVASSSMSGGLASSGKAVADSPLSRSYL